jgi:mannosyltransferase
VWPGAAVALFLALALWRLGVPSLWLDEIMSADFADGGLGELFAHLSHDVHAPGFYLLLWASLHTLGVSELAARLPAVLAGAATVGAVWGLARALRAPACAGPAAVILAVSPFFVEFSREAHPYSLSALACVLSWISLARLLRRESRSWMLAYAAACALALLSFYLTAFVLLAQLLFVAALRRVSRSKKLRAAAGMALGIAAFAALWGWALRAQMQGRAGRPLWIEGFYPEGVTPLHILGAVREIITGALWRRDPGGTLGLTVMALCAAGVAVMSGRGELGRRTRLPRAVAAWAFPVPFALFVGVCLVKPILVPRYLTMLAPFCALFFAAALWRAPRWASKPVLAGVVAVSLAAYAAYLRSMPREDWRGAVRILVPLAGGEDVIVAPGANERSCAAWYLAASGRADLADNVFPWESFAALTAGAFPDPARTLWYVQTPRDDSAAQVRTLDSRNTRVGTTPLDAGFVLRRYRGSAKP